jgi:hypothetical protein
MLEAVVPISNRVEVRRNLDRLDMLLKSCDFFWRGKERFHIHIVVPDDELTDISSWVRSRENLTKLTLTVRSETSISPMLASVAPSFGVMKQMLIKLACFQFVKSDFCILFDSDVVACKPFSDENLIVNGRALTEWLRPSLHEWWRESARILAYDLAPDELHQSRMFVTPQIFVKPVLEAMLQDVSRKLGVNWMTGLISEYTGKHPDIWTEYTLYDLFAARNGLRESHHIGQDEIPGERLHCMEQSIWGAHQFEKWTPLRAIDGIDPGYFLVLQSITASLLDFDVVKKRWFEAVGERFDNYPV